MKEALERMKQRRASAGGECHASPRGKGHARGGGVLSSGARREVVRSVRLPSFSYLGTKFLRSESSLTSPRKFCTFLAIVLLSFLWPGLGSSRAPGFAKKKRNDSTEERGRAETSGGGDHSAQ